MKPHRSGSLGRSAGVGALLSAALLSACGGPGALLAPDGGALPTELEAAPLPTSRVELWQRVGAAPEAVLDPSSGGAVTADFWLPAADPSGAGGEAPEQIVEGCRSTRVSPSERVSAGRLSVRWEDRVVALEPSARTGEYLWSDTQASWQAGTSILVVGEGARVPSFATAVRFPGTLQVRAPAQGDLSLRVPTAVVLAWSGSARTVRATLASEQVRVDCDFDGAAGRAVLPAAASAELRGQLGVLYVSALERQTLRVGPYSIEVAAHAVALSRWLGAR